MSKPFTESVTDLDLKLRQKVEAKELAERYQLLPDVAERIVAMSRSLDQAHAIAELMR